MDDKTFEITKIVAKEIARDVYNDGLKGGMTQTGQIIESVVGIFNNVIFYPVKVANEHFKYRLEDFKLHLEEKLKRIPEENIIEPDLMIAGPTLEALKYTYNKEELRNMYLNLLTSSMDKVKSNDVHPSYVDVIKQMNSLDAVVFKKILEVDQVACAHPILKIKGTNKVYSVIYPNYVVEELLVLGDPFDISTSINNLIRLGVIHHESNSITDYNYDGFKQNQFIIERKELIDAINRKDQKNIETEISIEQHVLMLNDFGRRFGKTCLE